MVLAKEFQLFVYLKIGMTVQCPKIKLLHVLKWVLEYLFIRVIYFNEMLWNNDLRTFLHICMYRQSVLFCTLYSPCVFHPHQSSWTAIAMLCPLGNVEVWPIRLNCILVIVRLLLSEGPQICSQVVLTWAGIDRLRHGTYTGDSVCSSLNHIPI